MRNPDNDTEVRIEKGSGDVFADLGIDLSPEEALKVEIARLITKVIVTRRLTQKEAGTILGVDQAKVSMITRGRLDGFSIERLTHFLLSLGWDMNISFKPSREPMGKVIVKADRAFA